MTQDRRAAEQHLLKALHDQLHSHEVRQMLALLELKLEAAKEGLVGCQPDQFARLQGEAQAYDKLLNQVRREPILPPRTTK